MILVLIGVFQTYSAVFYTVLPFRKTSMLWMCGSPDRLRNKAASRLHTAQPMADTHLLQTQIEEDSLSVCPILHNSLLLCEWVTSAADTTFLLFSKSCQSSTVLHFLGQTTLNYKIRISAPFMPASLNMIAFPAPESCVKEVVTWCDLGLCGSMYGGSKASD